MYRAMCLLLLLTGIHCGKNGGAEPGPGDRIPGLGTVCSKAGWCWENPLPHGRSLNAVWGADSNNVWPSEVAS